MANKNAPVFDPTKPYGEVMGIDEKHPTARYQQGPYLFTTHHKCLNPGQNAPSKQTPQQAADEEIKNTLLRELNTLTVSIGKLSKKVEAGTASATEKNKLGNENRRYEEVKSSLGSLD